MTSQPTVRVRIAVAVDSTGKWNAVGWTTVGKPGADFMMESAVDGFGEGDVATHWVEADVPLPLPPQTIQGEVSDAD